MKVILFSICIFFISSFQAKAQEENNVMQKQPQPITETQVEKHTALAQQERKKYEEEKNVLKEEKQKAEDKNISSKIENTSSAGKTSKQPGKQQ